MFIMTLTEYSNQGTDSTAIAVIAFGGGPNLLEKLTLLERFDATSLGMVLKIKYCLFFFKYIYYNLFSNLNFIISFFRQNKIWRLYTACYRFDFLQKICRRLVSTGRFSPFLFILGSLSYRLCLSFFFLEFKEKICSTLNLDNNNLSTNTDCVMVTDSLPTELHNDFLSGNVSSPKDECQKFSKTYEKKVNNITSNEKFTW